MFRKLSVILTTFEAKLWQCAEILIAEFAICLGKLSREKWANWKVWELRIIHLGLHRTQTNELTVKAATCERGSTRPNSQLPVRNFLSLNYLGNKFCSCLSSRLSFEGWNEIKTSDIPAFGFSNHPRGIKLHSARQATLINIVSFPSNGQFRIEGKCVNVYMKSH